MQKATTSRKASLTCSCHLGRHSLPLLGAQGGLVFAEKMDGWAGHSWCPSLACVCLRAETGPRNPREGLWNEGQMWWGRVSRVCPALGRALSAAGLLPPGCPQNRFGVNCEHVCSCRNGGLCHASDGSCSCGLGWTGPNCEQGECAGPPTGPCPVPEPAGGSGPMGAGGLPGAGQGPKVT